MTKFIFLKARIPAFFAALSALHSIAAFGQQVDVSGQVNITKSGLVLNRATRTFDSVVTLTNSLIPISGPVSLVITGITPNTVSLANASGTTTAGQPYVNIPPPSNPWAPGTSTTTVLKFSNPLQTQFTFTTQVLAMVQAGYGPGSVIAIVDSNGGTVTLPSVASLTIPPGSVTSAAVQILQASSPQVPFLMSALPEFTLLNAPGLKVKSSVGFTSPTLLQVTVPGLQGQLPAGTAPQVLALQLAGDDSSGASLELENLGGAACGDGNVVCVLLSQDAFLPNPLDPTDPVITLVIAAGPVPRTGFTPLWQLNAQSSAPTQPVSASQATFTADILLSKAFSFTNGAPLSSNVITGAFKRRRCIPACAPHSADDLRAAVGTSVYSPLEGTLTEKLARDGSNSNILYDELSHSVTVGNVALATQYLHLNPDQPQVPAQDDPVNPGTLFAISGISGTTAAHLHFAAKLNGTAIDPRPLMASIFGQSVDNLSLYLLPPDDEDSLRTTERSRLYLALYVNGVQQNKLPPLGELRFYPSLFSYTTTKGDVGDAAAEVQSAVITPVPSSLTPTGSTISTPVLPGGTTLLSYNSGPVDLQSMLTAVASSAGFSDVNLFLQSATVEVRLLWDNFRFGTALWEVANWNLSSMFTSQVTVFGSPNPSATGVPVTLSAQVSVASDQTVPPGLFPTGTVTFMDGTSTLPCYPGTVIAGLATCTTSFSTAGTHNITAQYSGDTSFACVGER
jgi:murein DD-endopeptidase MepM/ murein hydrolase activator NlpD